MKNKERGIKKRLIDWLWSAININNLQVIHIGEKSAVASDGFRAHAVNIDELPDSIHGIDFISELLFEGEIPTTSFCINPKYLIDALEGFVPSESGTVKVRVAGDITAKTQRIIISDDSDSTAVVMCTREVTE